MKKKFYLLWLLIFIPALSQANKLQGNELLDSLLAELPRAKADTNMVKLLNNISFNYSRINPDKGLEYGLKSLNLVKMLKWDIGLNVAYRYIGLNYMAKNDYPKALENFTESLKLAEKLKSKSRIASSLADVGNIYKYQSNYKMALEYFFKALGMYEDLKDKMRTAWVNGLIGSIYVDQSDYDKGLEYMLKALKLDEELNLKAYSASFLEVIGDIYQNKSDNDKALEYYFKSLNMYEETGNKGALPHNLINIGIIFINKNNYPKGLEYTTGALKVAEELNNKLYAAMALSNIAQIYFNRDSTSTSPAVRQSLYLKTSPLIKRALAIAKEIGELNLQQGYYEELSHIQRYAGKYKEALESYEASVHLKDSIFNESSTKKIAALEMKHVEEVKGKEIEMLKKEKEVTVLEAKHSIFQRNIFIAGILLAILVAIVLLIILRRVNRLNKDITIEKEKSEQLGIVKDKLFSIISHDLRSPLASLDATTKLLRNSKMDPEMTNNLLDNLDVSLAATINLMDGLLMWSLSQMKNIELKPVQTNLNQVAAENIAMYKETANHKGVKLHNEVDDSINLVVDMHMMQIVARNLISNAIKYSYHDGEVLVSTKREDGQVIFSVKDNGMGLVTEQIKNILETGARVNSQTGTDDERGTGIGLGICNELLKKSGGYMTIDSVPEKGTTVSVHLPIDATA